jgi:hypothetical protein
MPQLNRIKNKPPLLDRSGGESLPVTTNLLFQKPLSEVVIIVADYNENFLH